MKLKNTLNIFVFTFLIVCIISVCNLLNIIVMDEIFAYGIILTISLIGITFIVLYLRRIKMLKND